MKLLVRYTLSPKSYILKRVCFNIATEMKLEEDPYKRDSRGNRRSGPIAERIFCTYRG